MVAVGCVIALGTLACQRHSEPGADDAVDRLPLSLDDVKQISGFDGFTRDVDTDRPAALTYVPDGPCQALADQRVAFGDTWIRFRSIADNGELVSGRPRTRAPGPAVAPSTVPVVASALQTIAVYPSEVEARNVFDRRVAAMTECVGLNIPGYSGTVAHRDLDTAVYTNSTGGWAFVFVVKSAILSDVSVMALSDAERIASDISHVIIGRIN
ncbi:sensor domain-containing protein [Mycolicibacterium sp. XJ2]